MSDPVPPTIPQGAPQPNQQPSQQVPQVKIGSTIHDVANILTALTGMAYMRLYWSVEDGKFFVNNKGSWLEYRQFRPMKLTPDMLEKLKQFATSIPGGSLYYIEPKNVRDAFTKALN